MKDVTPLNPVLMLEGGKLQVRCVNIKEVPEAPQVRVTVVYNGTHLFSTSDEDVTEIARGLNGALDRIGKFVVAHRAQYESLRRQPPADSPNAPPLEEVAGPGSLAP
jgi:hypothetical protein